MLPEIWEPNLTVVFVGTAIAEPSDTLGFYYLHPRDRFWELLELSGITPKRMITVQERKALTDGHKDGSLSEPVRVMFTQKKTSQLLKLGIGLTHLNRRVVPGGEKDKAARPTDDDIRQFIARAEGLRPRILAFISSVDVFVELFEKPYPGATNTPGLQPFRIGNSEVWLLGATGGLLRGEALSRQEDVFVALGEAVSALRRESSQG